MSIPAFSRFLILIPGFRLLPLVGQNKQFDDITLGNGNEYFFQNFLTVYRLNNESINCENNQQMNNFLQPLFTDRPTIYTGD